jgi:FkbM family methyltransferase
MVPGVPKRFDRIEVAAICVAGVLFGMLLAMPRTPAIADPLAGRAIINELAPILAQHGPPQFSSHEQELFVRDFFADRSGGTFVDVGAGHYRDGNNTYFLEQEREWSGIAIDAQARFGPEYRQHRPRTRFFNRFVSDASNQTARLYIGRDGLIASSSLEFTEAYGPVVDEVDVPTITLTDLLNAEGIERIDFLSMDIELAEPQALAGFDIDRFRPALVGVEAYPKVRQDILNYFTSHGYVAIGRYLRADPENLWFAPLGTHLPDPLRGHRH